jgi:hypothetical protein
MAKKKTDELIELKAPNIKKIDVTIKGITPLNVHRLGKKLKDELEERDKGKPKKRKRGVVRDKQAEFMDSLYFIDKNGNEVKTPNKLSPNTRYGYPASGLKKAMVSACRNYDNMTMAAAKGWFFVLGQFIEIKGRPVLDENWVRIGGNGEGTGTPHLGIRAKFPEWSAKITISYFADLISASSIVNLLATAGQCVGLGEDRPGKKGNTFGMWKIAI